MTIPSSTLIRQIRVIDPTVNANSINDLLVVNGIIQAIEPHINHIPSDTTIFDGNGLILGPGLMDLYSYSGEPGYEDRETLESLSDSAIAGGFTQVAILPNTHPSIDNLATLSHLQQQVKLRHPAVKLDFWGHLTLGGKGQQMTELAELATAGVIGFTDNQGIENLGLFRRLLEYLKPLKTPIAIVPEYPSLKGNGVMREGYASICYGLPGNPALTEATAVATLLEMAAATQTPIHLIKLSTSRAVELIAWGKARGIPVTASTSWMHLLLDTEAIASYHPSLRLDPPLGNKEDRLALIDGVAQGIIDAIAIDHHGYTYEEKTVPFAEAPPGAIGLQMALPLLWQALVETGQWSELQLWKALSLNPRQCVGQTLRSLKPGNMADFIIFDPHKSWKITPLTLKSLSTNTPWLGQEIQGQVIQLTGHDNETLT